MTVWRRICARTPREGKRGRERGLGPSEPGLVLDDLPEGVLVDDLVALKAIDVAALVVQLLAVAALAAHGPDRNRPVACQDVFLVLPAHVGDLPKAVGEGLADRRLAFQGAADRLGPARQAERRILRETSDDPLDIATIERGRNRPHQ